MYKISKYIGWRFYNKDQVLVVNTEDGNVFILTEVSKIIWEGIVSSFTNQEIVDNILEEYDIRKNIVEADVISFINKLKLKKVLV